MCQHQSVILTHRARDNREYVRALLRERQPEFLALLQSAERQISLDLVHESQD